MAAPQFPYIGGSINFGNPALSSTQTLIYGLVAVGVIISIGFAIIGNIGRRKKRR